MAVVSWSRQFTLTSSLGSMTIDPRLLDPAQCSAGAGLRITSDPVSAGDGAVFHARFKDGYQMHLMLQLLDAAGNFAIDDDLQTVYDELMGHLDAMIDADGRLSWKLSSGNDRMLDRIRTLEMPGPSGSLPKQFAFAVESPLPYAMDAPETDTALPAGTVVAITRGGSAKGFRPVAIVNGATTAFTLENITTGKKVIYDSTLPGASAIAGGHYAEIDFFKETVTLDGNVAFLSEGIDWPNTDFWDLIKGAQSVKLTGASGTLKWQAAHA